MSDTDTNPTPPTNSATLSVSSPASGYPGSFPEDFPHENGNYQNKCRKCRRIFIGHKRRPKCKVCQEADETEWNALSDDEKRSRLHAANKDLKKLIG